MKILRILSALFFISLWGLMAYAHIYSWTDENGVTHFTNYSPPAEARIVVKDVVTPRGEATEKEARANEEPVGKPSERERDLEERGLDLESKLEGSLERAEDLVENLETRLIEANQRARQAEALARDVERRIFEADREEEDAIRNAEALADEPYSTEPDYYWSLTYPYAYGYGFVSIHRPADLLSFGAKHRLPICDAAFPEPCTAFQNADEAEAFLNAGCGWIRQVTLAPELPGAGRGMLRGGPCGCATCRGTAKVGA